MEPWFSEAEARAVYKYMKSGGWMMEFNKTRELETRIADFVGTKYCVMTVNGTVGLIMALLALGLAPGDEVIIPDLTMIATPNAPVLLGLKPVLVDVEPHTLCLDLTVAQKSLTSKTRVLIYVAFNGRTGNMHQLKSFCQRHKLHLIEDAAQALGSYWNSKHLGTIGEIGSFSFSVPKIITTGQGGALVTDNKRLYTKIKKIKDFGRIKNGVDIHDEFGWNFKFTDLQAVVGLEQMKKLNFRVKRKKEIWQRYYENLRIIKEIEFLPTNQDATCPWFIDIYIDQPDKLKDYLANAGVGTRRIYPAISSQKIYKHSTGHFPVSDKYSRRGLWLPSSSKLTNADIDYIIEKIRTYFQSN